MKALIVIGAVLLLLFFIMMLPLKLFFQVENEACTLHFGILMVKLRIYPKKTKKAAKKAMKKTMRDRKKEQRAIHSEETIEKATANPKKSDRQPKASAVDAPKSKTEERSLKETFFLIVDIIRSLVRPTRFLLRQLQITDLSLHAVVGGEEPDETAIRFGHWNAAVYGGLATLKNFLRIKCKKINIAVDFTSPETELRAEGVLKLRVFAAIWAVLSMLFNLLVNTLKRAKEEEQPLHQTERKAAA